MSVTETFFSVNVTDLNRATAFYVKALGAEVMHATPFWTSISLARVRIGLFLHPPHTPTRVGLHFVVSGLAETLAAIRSAGGQVSPPSEVAPGVVTVDVVDTEGNGITLREG